MKTMILFLLSLTTLTGNAQTVVNGDFNGLTSGWSCSPEATYFETTYGGVDPTNRVAEVDAVAGLCQTISGFIIGNSYTLRIDVSRRTTCGPTLQTMDVTVDGGVLSASVSRNGTPFSWGTESFVFVATSTTHTIDFSGTVAGTCGLILDNVSIIPNVPLPVELISFNVEKVDDRTAIIEWMTSTEVNNDYFEIVKSTDGESWNVLAIVQGNGTTGELTSYSILDENLQPGNNYYRLVQYDFSGEKTIYSIKQLEGTVSIDAVFPNPANDQISITSVNLDSFVIVDSQGQNCMGKVNVIYSTKHETKLDISLLNSGMYLAVQGNTVYRFVKK